MPVHPSDFKDALAQFASGITIVTTKGGDGKPLGLTVNAFCSVSLDPPLVLVCIDNRSEAHAGFQASRVFGVSVLAEGQEAFSQRFATPGARKFEPNDLEQGESGVALVPHALAHIECKVSAAHPGGDHTLYVGEVLRLAARPGRPLLYHARGYRRIERETPTA